MKHYVDFKPFKLEYFVFVSFFYHDRGEQNLKAISAVLNQTNYLYNF